MMQIFCYGSFLELELKHHRPPSPEKKLTKEQQWAQKCGKRWNRAYPLNEEIKPMIYKNEPECTPVDISEKYIADIGDVIVDIASYQNHYLFLTSRGDVFSLGEQNYGKCGIDESKYKEIIQNYEDVEDADKLIAKEMEEYVIGVRNKAIKIMSNADTIATGRDHSVIITKFGDVYSFGNGSKGQLGNGRIGNVFYPKKIPFFGKNGVYGPAVHATCGEYHSMILTKNKIVYGFGRGKEGQLGILPFLDFQGKDKKLLKYFDCHPAPRSVKSYDLTGGTSLNENENETVLGTINKGRIYKPLVDVCCGSRSTSVLTSQRKILTFGEGITGYLAQGHTKNLNFPTPIKWKSEEKKLIRLESGWNHFVCVNEQGEAYSTGLNLHGQCGVGHTNNVKLLEKIKGLEKCTIEKIGCGGSYSACLTEKRELYVCGYLPGRFNNHLEMTKINWFEENGFKIINIFCCGKNLFVQTVKEMMYVADQESYQEDNSIHSGSDSEQDSILSASKDDRIVEF